MGGRPLAMVNVVGISESKYYEEIMRGIQKGCEKFKVPMVGGHLHPDTREVSVSVAILGVARSLLFSNNAREGQNIIFAVDLDGRGYQCKPVISWDTNSGKNSQQVLARLEILPQLAEKELCATAKDVSNGGLLGTIALLLETSQRGAFIDIDRVPKPPNFPTIDWLKAFLSYGFILCADKGKTETIISEFKDKNITAAVIGEITAEQQLVISFEGEQGILFDFEREAITGITTGIDGPGFSFG
jgi:hypothetical protein